MNPIESVFNLHSGRVFLLGNGPSLNDYDLSKLNPNEVISMNRSWRSVHNCLYHCTSGDLRVNFNPYPQNLVFLGQPEQYGWNYKKKCPIILVQTKIAGVKIPKPKAALPIQAQFDLRLGWPPTHVGLFAVYFAYWLGFREIYLLGYDGYGKHFMKAGEEYWPEKKFAEKHRVMVPQFRNYIRPLLEDVPDLELYNCNSENEYKNLPVVDYNRVVA